MDKHFLQNGDEILPFLTDAETTLWESSNFAVIKQLSPKLKFQIMDISNELEEVPVSELMSFLRLVERYILSPRSFALSIY